LSVESTCGFLTTPLHLHTLTVNETPEERDDEKQWILQDLGDLHRHFLIVYLDASGTVTRNFRYALKAE
jgi:hypothetical protein